MSTVYRETSMPTFVMNTQTGTVQFFLASLEFNLLTGEAVNRPDGLHRIFCRSLCNISFNLLPQQQGIQPVPGDQPSTLNQLMAIAAVV
jgi:hypothetical protein